MNYRFFIIPAQWLVGLVAYIALSAALSNILVLSMLRWAHEDGISRGLALEIYFLRVPAFAMCLFWGALYASALAKPASFGHTTKILKHLGWSYFLGLSGCVFLIRMYFLPLPDFQTNFALSAFIFFGFSLSIVCFVLGLLVWVHLAFDTKQDLAKEHRKSAGLES